MSPAPSRTATQSPSSPGRPAEAPGPGHSPSRQPMTVGSYVGILGIVMMVAGMFLPMYGVEVSHPDYTDGAREPMLDVYTYRSPVIDTGLKEDIEDDLAKKDIEAGEMTEKINLGPMEKIGTGCMVAFVLALVVLIMTVFRLFIARKYRRRKGVMLNTGIILLVAMAIVMLLVNVAMPKLLADDGGSGGEPAEGSFEAVKREMADSPSSGSADIDTGEKDATLYWGFATGVWVMFAGAAVLVAGGVLEWALGRRRYGTS